MKNEIVSVVVVTYNSSETISETLESIKKQSYRKYIEIVISDDCSTDNTVNIIENWILKNQVIFNSIIFVKNGKNLGITRNFNKAIQNANGEYIKLLSGDDVLFSSSSISTYIESIGEKEIVCSPVSIFGSDIATKLTIQEHRNFHTFLKMSERNKKKMVYSNSIYSPKITGTFFRKSLIIKMGLFNESYLMMEDYPFMVKIFQEYYDKVIFLDNQLYSYRVRKSILEEFLLSKRKIEHVKSLNKFRKEEVLPLLYKEHYYLQFLINAIRMLLSDLEIKNIFFGKVFFKLRKFLKRY